MNSRFRILTVVLTAVMLLASACSNGTDGDPTAARGTSSPAADAPAGTETTPAPDDEPDAPPPAEDGDDAPGEPGPEDQGPPPQNEDETSTEPVGLSLHAVSSEHGEILVDNERRTLYVFTDDQPDVSNCRGSCLNTWPPVYAESAEAGEGTDPALVGSTTSNEAGRAQLTYNRLPLYYYSGDGEPGATSGQGVGGKWYVVSPEGEPVR